MVEHAPYALPREGYAPRGKSLTAARAERIGRAAIHSMYREAALVSKPGLVSPVDNGSHRDMNFQTFMRSLVALREYFPAIAARGAQQPSFHELQQLGIAAEAQMLAATNGVNTHRGAIFNLGLLCAAAGWRARPGVPLVAKELCDLVRMQWGGAILAGLSDNSESHGLSVARRYGKGGARVEAAGGFPTAIDIGLPAYRQALAATGERERASMQALFALIAHLGDSNLLWRGGPSGLSFAQQAAAEFLASGGVYTHDWEARAEEVHREFVARNLSPGGSADVLCVTLFLHAIETEQAVAAE